MRFSHRLPDNVRSSGCAQLVSATLPRSREVVVTLGCQRTDAPWAAGWPGPEPPVQFGRIVNRAAEHGIPARPTPRHDQHDGGLLDSTWECADRSNCSAGATWKGSPPRTGVQGRRETGGLEQLRQCPSPTRGAAPSTAGSERSRLGSHRIPALAVQARRHRTSCARWDGAVDLRRDGMGHDHAVLHPGSATGRSGRAATMGLSRDKPPHVRRGPGRKAGPLVPAHGSVRCVVRRDIAPIGPALPSSAHVR